MPQALPVLSAHPTRTFVSGGINAKLYPACTVPRQCTHLTTASSRERGAGANTQRTAFLRRRGYPTGCTPSVASDGGCIHNFNPGGVTEPPGPDDTTSPA